MRSAVGDKVKIKTGPHLGERGLIVSLAGERLVVRLDGTNASVRVRAMDITNYSLAARKAWKTEPGRKVGRRKGSRFCNRVSVTLRIDQEVWEEFQAKEKSGAIADRTAVINAWLREKLGAMGNGGSESDA